MIKNIEIFNFRPHINLKLKDLSPNLNVIIGNTGTGKTSIFRALRFLFSNEPSNGSKLYKFKENLKFMVKTNINDVILWREARKYKIKKDDGKVLTFTTFGKKIPQPIKEIINLQSINWQLQTQPHFLILDNGGTVARYLNPIMGSEESDLLLEETKKQISSLRTEVKILNSVISENEKICNKLKNIGGYKKEVNELQNKIEHLQELEKNIFFLDEKSNEINKINKKIVNPIKLNLFKINLQEIELKLTDANNLKLDIHRLIKKIDEFKNTKFISVKQHLEIIKDIEEKRVKKSILQHKKDNLQFQIKSYKTITENIKESLKEYSNLKDKWDMEYSKLKICLFCGQEIKNANYSH